MKVNKMVKALGLQVLAGEEGLDREVNGVYICDLLSFVMSHGKKGNVWITVQIHPNIIAVAVLLELSCIILPENLEIEQLTLEKANTEKIAVLKYTEDAYSLAAKLKELGV